MKIVEEKKLCPACGKKKYYNKYRKVYECRNPDCSLLRAAVNTSKYISISNVVGADSMAGVNCVGKCNSTTPTAAKAIIKKAFKQIMKVK